MQWPVHRRRPARHADDARRRVRARARASSPTTVYVPTTERANRQVPAGAHHRPDPVAVQRRRPDPAHAQLHLAPRGHPRDPPVRRRAARHRVRRRGRAVVSRVGTTRLTALVSERMPAGVVYTTFHHPVTGANVVTTENSDWATNCPEYKVTAVQVEVVTEAAAQARGRGCREAVADRGDARRRCAADTGAAGRAAGARPGAQLRGAAARARPRSRSPHTSASSGSRGCARSCSPASAGATSPCTRCSCAPPRTSSTATSTVRGQGALGRLTDPGPGQGIGRLDLLRLAADQAPGFGGEPTTARRGTLHLTHERSRTRRFRSRSGRGARARVACGASTARASQGVSGAA